MRLLPLATGQARAADLLDRYNVIQEFRRGSKQFGSQRQTRRSKTRTSSTKFARDEAGFGSHRILMLGGLVQL